MCSVGSRGDSYDNALAEVELALAAGSAIQIDAKPGRGSDTNRSLTLANQRQEGTSLQGTLGTNRGRNAVDQASSGRVILSQ